MKLSEAISEFAGRRRLLVASDFDGVLSEIVPEPDAAVPIAGAQDALEGLALLPMVVVVLVSGRRLDDLSARFDGLAPEVITVGEHGSAWPGRARPRPTVLPAVMAGLAEIADSAEQAWVEEKRSGLSFHLRNVDESRKDQLRSEVLLYLREATAGVDPEPRVDSGRGIVEVSFSGIDKSDAVEEMRSASDAGAVLFFGDDVSDEPVFARLGPDDIGVKVGTGATSARFRVEGPREVVATLDDLISLRGQ